jgi:hypothetical protein
MLLIYFKIEYACALNIGNNELKSIKGILVIFNNKKYLKYRIVLLKVAFLK